MQIPTALVFAALLASTTAAQGPADNEIARSRGAQLAWDNGFHTCNAVLDLWVKFVHEDDREYGFAGLWAENRTDDSGFSLTTSQPFDETVKITVFNVSKNKQGKCDASYFSSWTVNSSCSEIRENVVKDWNFKGEMSGSSVYSEPELFNHEIYLSPLPMGRCTIGKKIATFNIEPDAPDK